MLKGNSIRLSGQEFFRNRNVFSKTPKTCFRDITIDLIAHLEILHLSSHRYHLTGNICTQDRAFGLEQAT